jgi:uncharacterized tellurite resistance protein B-like protein
MFWFIAICVVVIIVVALSRKPKGTAVVTVSGRRTPMQASPPPLPGIAWLGLDDRLEVGGFRLEGPTTYTSKRSSPVDEASCIDQSLRVGRPVAEAKGALGYWPRYCTLSPDQKANYLYWLSRGRTGRLEDVGYAFLFFYGLERRALVDREDTELVLNETNRLMHQYGESRSFFGYASSFIAFLLARTGLENIPKESFEAVFRDSLKAMTEETLSVGLAWLVNAGEPLPGFMAYEVARLDIRASASVVIRRVPEHFRALFLKKYQEHFGAGITLRTAARERLIEYKPASPTLVGLRTIAGALSIRVPNVLGLPSQFKDLVEMWDACIEELKPLSREVGKGRDVDTREAFAALPEALKAEVDHPDMGRWDAFVSSHADHNAFTITKASDLAGLCGIAERPRLTLNQSVDLAQTACDVGFVLVPDPRVSGRALKWDDVVAVFRPEGGPRAPDDRHYKAVSLLLEIGVAVAASDGQIEAEEMDHIVNFLKGQFMLDPDDARSVEAYREVLTRQPPSLSGVARRIRTSLAADQLEKVGQFLVGVAAADGKLERQERNTLRKVYTALGVDLARLDELVARLQATAAAPVEVGEAVLGRPGELIPQPAGHAVLTINEDAVRDILRETEEVASLLGSVLADAAEPEVSAELPRPTTHESTIAATPTTGPRLEGLDARYHAFVEDLAAKGEWSQSDFSGLVRRHQLMPAAAVEAVNTWADERLGDYLIEEGESYRVNATLLEK